MRNEKEITERFDFFWDKLALAWHYESLSYLKAAPGGFPADALWAYKLAGCWRLFRVDWGLRRWDRQAYRRDMALFRLAAGRALGIERPDFRETAHIGKCVALLAFERGGIGSRPDWERIYKARLEKLTSFDTRTPEPGAFGGDREADITALAQKTGLIMAAFRNALRAEIEGMEPLN